MRTGSRVVVTFWISDLSILIPDFVTQLEIHRFARNYNHGVPIPRYSNLTKLLIHDVFEIQNLICFPNLKSLAVGCFLSANFCRISSLPIFTQNHTFTDQFQNGDALLIKCLRTILLSGWKQLRTGSRVVVTFWISDLSILIPDFVTQLEIHRFARNYNHGVPIPRYSNLTKLLIHDVFEIQNLICFPNLKSLAVGCFLSANFCRISSLPIFTQNHTFTDQFQNGDDSEYLPNIIKRCFPSPHFSNFLVILSFWRMISRYL